MKEIELFKHIKDRLGLFVPNSTYDNYVSLIIGYDLAKEHRLLKGFDREQPKEDTGIVLFNRGASLEADAAYQVRGRCCLLVGGEAGGRCSARGWGASGGGLGVLHGGRGLVQHG